jgi:hypothetical protein
MDMEVEYKAEKLWKELDEPTRVKLLSYFQFWGGFSAYLYEYLPEPFREILRHKITDNYPYWL